MPDWTPVALLRDLPPLVVMPVTVDGVDLALWRSASGRIAAWADRCPHRGMRLSHGFVRGEALSCIYHGWSYAQSGQCQRIPAHPDLEPPEAIRVPVHHATEAGGVIWVALDTVTTAPPALAGVQPLRSVTLDARFDPASAGLTESGGAWRGTLGGVAVAVLVQPLPENRCALHVLADANASSADLVTASRGIETLRRQAEGICA